MNYQMHTLLAIIIVFWKIIHNEVNLVSFLVYGNSGKNLKQNQWQGNTERCIS